MGQRVHIGKGKRISCYSFDCDNEVHWVGYQQGGIKMFQMRRS